MSGDRAPGYLRSLFLVLEAPELPGSLTAPSILGPNSVSSNKSFFSEDGSWVSVPFWSKVLVLIILIGSPFGELNYEGNPKSVDEKFQWDGQKDQKPQIIVLYTQSDISRL